MPYPIEEGVIRATKRDHHYGGAEYAHQQPSSCCAAQGDDKSKASVSAM
ncbi:hypothetical protein ACI3KW_00695 [Devosia sp. ZW T5_3]